MAGVEDKPSHRGGRDGGGSTRGRGGADDRSRQKDRHRDPLLKTPVPSSSRKRKRDSLVKKETPPPVPNKKYVKRDSIYHHLPMDGGICEDVDAFIKKEAMNPPASPK